MRLWYRSQIVIGIAAHNLDWLLIYFPQSVFSKKNFHNFDFTEFLHKVEGSKIDWVNFLAKAHLLAQVWKVFLQKAQIAKSRDFWNFLRRGWADVFDLPH